MKKTNIYPRILIAAPTSFHKDYCLKEWVKQYNNFTYPNKSLLIIDNSPNKKHLNKIRKYLKSGKVRHMREGKNLREIICNCQNYIRYYAIKNDFDYILSLETDIFIDDNPSIIEYLVTRAQYINSMVLGIPYFTFTGEKSRYLMMKANKYGDYMTSSLNTNFESFMFHSAQIKKGFLFGIGCVLLHKAVIKNVPFRLENDNNSDELTHSHSDSYFHEDLYRLGINTWVDTNFIARHENGNWGDVYKIEKRN